MKANRLQARAREHTPLMRRSGEHVWLREVRVILPEYSYSGPFFSFFIIPQNTSILAPLRTMKGSTARRLRLEK